MGNLTFTGSSGVTGASESLSSGENHDISVTIAAPLSIWVPGLDTDRVSLGNFELKAFGIGLGGALSYYDNTSILMLEGDLGAVLGIQGNFGYDFQNFEFIGDWAPQLSFGFAANRAQL